MGIITRAAIELGMKEHLRIVEEEKKQKLTASLWIAGYEKSFKARATAVYEEGGTHPDIQLYNTFMDFSNQGEEFWGVRHVYLYTYYCPCFNCKEKWKGVPEQFRSINFKWAFCKWYIPPPNTYGRYNSLENAQHHMSQMVGLGWSMRQYSTTITDNVLSSVEMVAKIPGPTT
jgi:hypothetical protein